MIYVGIFRNVVKSAIDIWSKLAWSCKKCYWYLLEIFKKCWKVLLVSDQKCWKVLLVYHRIVMPRDAPSWSKWRPNQAEQLFTHMRFYENLIRMTWKGVLSLIVWSVVKRFNTQGVSGNVCKFVLKIHMNWNDMRITCFA